MDNNVNENVYRRVQIQEIRSSFCDVNPITQNSSCSLTNDGANYFQDQGLPSTTQQYRPLQANTSLNVNPHQYPGPAYGPPNPSSCISTTFDRSNLNASSSQSLSHESDPTQYHVQSVVGYSNPPGPCMQTSSTTQNTWSAQTSHDQFKPVRPYVEVNSDPFISSLPSSQNRSLVQSSVHGCIGDGFNNVSDPMVHSQDPSAALPSTTTSYNHFQNPHPPSSYHNVPFNHVLPNQAQPVPTLRPLGNQSQHHAYGCTKSLQHSSTNYAVPSSSNAQTPPVIPGINTFHRPLEQPSRSSGSFYFHNAQPSNGLTSCRDVQIQASRQAFLPQRRHHICKWIVTHKNGSEYPCGRVFQTITDLATHLSKDHRNGGQGKQFYCKWLNCDKANHGFQQSNKLRLHLRVHTGEKPFRCKSCGKTFARKENCDTHLRVHTQEKPFPCSYPGCGKRFGNSSDRSKHNYTHSKEKKYICKVCAKKYQHPSSLKKHNCKKTHN